jgi:hypothetical protein
MKDQSFIQYLFNKINSKLTFISKILLLLFSCSLFIPVPTGTITDANVMTKLLTIYLSLVTTYGIGLFLFLAGTYFNFILGQASEKNKFKRLLTSIIIGPIISYVIYLKFNIIIPLQLILTLPPLALFTIYVFDFILFGTESASRSKNFTFDFTKIKRIFFKK